MNWRVILLLLLAGFAALAPSAVRAAPPLPPPEQQILVMVRHPPDHFRSSGGYAGGYGDELARSARDRLARSIAKDYGLTRVDAYPMPLIGIDCLVMAVPPGRSTASVAEQISHDRRVAWTQPVQQFHAQGEASHNDPLFAAQPAAREWHLADLHRIATGRGVKVAVIDSGIDAAQPDLAGQLLVNRNFVAGHAPAAEAHGTGVAGIIAARADNRIGIAGVAPGAGLLGLRACWQPGPSAASTTCDSLSLAKALYFALAEKADVINLSLSGPDDRLLRELVRTAIGNGSTVVAAFDGGRADGGFPASLAGVIPVSDMAVAPSRARVYTAPGRDVPTTEPGGRWFLVNGSSYAAAHVSGLAALVREKRRSAGLTLVSVRAEGGLIDACATLVHAVGRCDCSCGPSRLASAAAHR